MNDLIDSYIAIWNETDAGRRRALIARTWTEDAHYLDPLMHGCGHDGIDAMVAAVQQRFPQHRFSRCGEVDSYRDRLRFCWRLAPVDPQAPDAMRAQGTDFAVVSDGRLQSVTGFLDPAAPVAAPAGWSVERFAAFWRQPDMRHVGSALTPDVVGYWPGSSEPLRGVADYTQRIADLLARVPDFRLEVAEHASSGDCTFIRWIARGTRDGEAFEFGGVDRVRTRDGLVAENRIYCDHPLIRELAAGSPETAAA